MLALAFELICAALAGAAIGTEADSFFSDKGNKPKIGHAFLAIDPGALAGHDRYFERVETVITAMLADEGVRLPGSRRFASEKKLRAGGIEIGEFRFQICKSGFELAEDAGPLLNSGLICLHLGERPPLDAHQLVDDARGV